MTVVERIDEVFSVLAQPGMPGGALAVLSNGEVLCRSGYGLADIDAGVPFTPSTPFPIASMTKQFTTTCVLLLEEEGHLSLQDDYRKYLPEMPDFGTIITLDHLCSNTSGIRDIFALTTLAGGHWLAPRPRSLVVDTLRRQRSLNFPTGSQYRYSNPNFAMLSWIVERVTGRRLADFMAERIFQPLGMHATRLQDPREPARVGGARCYDGTTRETLRPSRWEDFSRSGSGEGGGAIWSTLDDLILWERNFDHNVIGSPGLLRRLTSRPQIPGGELSFYARGLFVGVHRGLEWQGHSGSFGPCSSNRTRFPGAALSVIILTNSALVDPFLGVFDVADRVLGQGRAIAPAPEYRKAVAEELEPWFGTYEDSGSGLSFGLTGRDGVAQVIAFGNAAALEEATPGILLAARGGSLPIQVIPGPAGPVPEITVRLGPNPPMVMRRSPPPTLAIEGFAGEYFSDELGASHFIEVDRDRASVTIDGPQGRLDGLPLERVSEESFIADLGSERHALYRFSCRAAEAPVEAMVSIARAERLRLRRIAPR